MSLPILKTKLHVPSIHKNIVSRPRLLQRLESGIGGKLTLISAPAGFGKSTLLSAWVNEQDDSGIHPSRVAWLSLDEGDNDLGCFLSYFVAALQTIECSIGKGTLVTLQSPGTVKPEVVLTNLLNEMAEFPPNTVLIIDDYHVIESQLIDDALTFLLDHLPSQVHLVISSRIDPSLPLPRLRARRQMTEFRADDLRFTLDEASVFLNRVTGFDLSTEIVASLGERTEGWITGLQLAVLSMQSSDDIGEFVRAFTGSDRHILDYLGEEVLAHQSHDVKTFLLQTSILNRLTGPLCDAVTRENNGEAMLENLERKNVFIIPLDNERNWYRYHHLFADMIERRLHQTQPKLVPQLHSRASEWYALQDFHSDAVHHALAGNDFDRAVFLIKTNGLHLIGQGAFSTVQNWINALPKNILRDQPYLCVYQAWASNFTLQLEAIEPYLQDALCALHALKLPPDDEVTKDIKSHITTLRACNAPRQRNNALAIKLMTEAVEYLGDGSPFVRTFAELNLGLAYLDEGELNKSANAFREAISQGQTSNNELARLIAISQLAAVLILQGRLHEAARLCRQTIRDQLARHEKPHPTMCMIYLRLSMVLAEWNDVDGYFENLSKSVILANQIGYDGVVRSGSISMIWYRQLLAKQGKTFELSKDIEKIMERVSSLDNNDGNSTIESQSIENYLSDDAYFEIIPGYSGIAHSKKMAAQGKAKEAITLLAQVYESAQNVEGTGLMIEARTSEALIHQSQGEFDRAIDALKDALSLSESEGYTRTYVDRDEPMFQLLCEVAARGIMPDYTNRLLCSFESGKDDDTTHLIQPLVEPLSKRELEILELIAQGLSNREISEQLYLALSTIKGHNSNIFDKLGVQRRTEAVARASELGLL